MATLVVDNGAGSIKIGYNKDNEPKVAPNCVTKAKNVRTRIFIGDQIDECKDLSGLYYLLPFQKGYLTNWEIEKQVWDHLFGKNVYKVNFDDTTIVLTEPMFNFQSVQDAVNEVLFEEYQFKAAHVTNAATLAQHKMNKENKEKQLCTLVVDSGYSFSHLVPYYNGKKIKGAIRRMDVGGKVLTNHLKEVISYRQLMVMDETYVINQMKEDICYISTDFYKDMSYTKLRGPENKVVRDYVLPDYTHIKRGYVRSPEESKGKSSGHEQIIRMNNERFAVPEILFHPSDVGIQQMGLPEAAKAAIDATPTDMRPHLYKNIVICGGNATLPGFKERFYDDLRKMAPSDFDINVRLPTNPITAAWEGGVVLSKESNFNKKVVTRQEYEEHGQNICLEKFDL